jgi:hypothetical protein
VDQVVAVVARDPGAGDEDVEPAELLDRPFDRGLQLRASRHVALDPEHLAGCPVEVEIRDRDSCSVCR